MIPKEFQPYYDRGTFDVAAISENPKFLVKFFFYNQRNATRDPASAQPLLNRLLDKILSVESTCRPDKQVRVICTQPDMVESGAAMTYLHFVKLESLTDRQQDKLFAALVKAGLIPTSSIVACSR